MKLVDSISKCLSLRKPQKVALEHLSAVVEKFAEAGIKIVYFPYTKGISSTKITEALKAARGWAADGKEVAAEEHLNQ